MQVILIQACQTYASDSQEEQSSSNSPSNAHDSSRPEEKSVILERPHTYLLMATVAGGKALRGAFSGALARQIAKADGKTSLDEMIYAAKSDIKSTLQRKKQIPEARNTLEKTLILPAPAVRINPSGLSGKSKFELLQQLEAGKSTAPKM